MGPRHVAPALLLVSLLAGAFQPGVSVSAQTPTRNSVQIENAKPGTADWKLTNSGVASGAIEGYASLTSVARGGQIALFVNTGDPTYTLEIFRMGFYQGLRARRMTPAITRTGTRQLVPAPDPITGAVECDWINPYILNVPNSADPTDWMSGIYYVKLTGSSGRQQYISFVVRDDARSADLVLADTVTTAQAYNVWGGKSLYGTIANRSDTANAARKVSFDRPYYGDETWGASHFSDRNDYRSWEWSMVGFLEANGYDVTYVTNIDVDQNPNLLLTHKVFLSVGHDEYWSASMRNNVEAARDVGVSLGFFSANTSYWQVRFESSTTLNAPARVMVGYKSACPADPITPNSLKTCRFRDAPVNRSEDRMIGGMYITQARSPLVVEDESSWLLTGTGLKNGQSLTNPDGSFFVGYEVDAMGAATPANAQRIAHSPATPAHANYSDMVIYRAPSGATVFSSGTIMWTTDVPQVVQITRNVLARLINGSFADAAPIRPLPPAPFQTAEVGDTGRPGFVSLASADGFTMNGAGQSAFGGRDAFFYVYRPWLGDGQITLRVTNLQQLWDNRAGIMIRETLDPLSKYVSIVVRPTGSRMNGTSGLNEGAEFKIKDVTGGAPKKLAMQDLPLPNWLKLVRIGNTFTAFVSGDGLAWTPLGSTTLVMTGTVLVGASVTSAQRGLWATANVDHVAVTADTSLPGPPPDPPPASTLPIGWLHRDVGAAGALGMSAYDAATGTFTVSGAGADVWGTADAFQFAHTTLAGDGRIVARVATVSAGAPWIKAGVMVRGTLDASSPHGFMLVSSAKGLAYQSRTTVGGLSTSIAGGALAAPRWVRLDRTGTAITAFQSADGVAWTMVGSATIAMAASVDVGLAVSSHTSSALATATFDHVAVTAATALPDGWVNRDIGAVGPAGMTAYSASAATFTISGAGADIWGTADALHYAYTTLAGDGRIEARVATLSAGAAWVKAGVMIRQSLDPGSPQALMLVSYAKGLALQSRAIASGPSSSVAGGVSTAPRWVRLDRTGNIVAAFQSADGITWTAVGSVTIAMGTTVDVGLAVSSHTTSALATATFDHVTITPKAP